MKTTHKEHHYVPKVYLKKWATKEYKNYYIKTLSLASGSINKSPTQKVAKKTNLYTLPDDFNIDDSKIIEKIIYGVWERQWSGVVSRLIEKERIPKIMDIKTLMAFIVVQSFRTPRFKTESKKLFELSQNKELQDMDFSHVFGILGIKSLELVDKSTIQLFQAPVAKRFITSDNPSTHWLFQNNSFVPVESIKSRSIMVENPNYRILCPITPYYLGIISPNVGSIELNRITEERMLSVEEVKLFNRLVELRSDRVLFAKHIKDFG